MLNRSRSVDIRGAYLEYHVRDNVGNIEVGGVRNFWRGVREKGGSDEPPESPPWLRA